MAREKERGGDGDGDGGVCVCLLHHLLVFFFVVEGGVYCSCIQILMILIEHCPY